MKVVVLLSGGLDSTTCLALYVKRYGADNVTALCLQYGQKHDKEVQCAERIASHYGCDFKVIVIPDLYKNSHCTLINGVGEVPEGTYEDQLKDRDIVSTYVPFRNGLFLSYAAAIAYDLGASMICYGAHKDDAKAAYPDCTDKFLEAMQKSILLGTGNKVHVRAPFIEKTKKDIVVKGIELNVPFELTWSCYSGGDRPCGKCATCLDRAKAFEANGIVDPLLSEEGE